MTGGMGVEMWWLERRGGGSTQSYKCEPADRKSPPNQGDFTQLGRRATRFTSLRGLALSFSLTVCARACVCSCVRVCVNDFQRETETMNGAGEARVRAIIGANPPGDE